MSVLIRLSISIVLLFGALQAVAQESKIADGEKALTEASRLEKNWWIAGNFEKIAENYENALAIWRESADKEREAKTLYRAALNFLRTDVKSEKARIYALRSAEIFKMLGDAEGEALATEIIAWNAGLVSPEKAKMLFEQGLALARKAKSPRAESRILESYAFLLNETDYENALEKLETALPLAEKNNLKESLARIHFIFGLIYYRLGDYEKSLAHYESAHKCFKEFGDFSWATTAVENAALVYNLLEQSEKVIESYQEALQFRRENKQQTAVADNLTSMATASVKLNQPTAALEKLAEALKIYEQTENKHGIAWVLRIYGEAHFALRNFDKAIEYFDNSRVLQAALNERNGEAKAIYGLAKTELARGNLRAAQRFVEDAVEKIESRLAELKNNELRLAFFASQQDFYKLHIEILERLHREAPSQDFEEQAFAVSERSRARNLFEILTGKTNSPSIGSDEIRRNLDADTALLEFSLGRRSSFLFVVTREQITLYKLPKSGEIKPLVEELRLALADSGRRNYARFVTASRQLYEILLKPAEPELKTKTNLLIVSDEALNYMPFEVLLTAEPVRTGRADFRSLPYLINRQTILYAPSAAVLSQISNIEIKSSNQNATDFVAFGDPLYGETELAASGRVTRFVSEIFNSKTLPRLADSNREVTEVAANFGNSARVFLRGEATEENLKRNRELRQARIIHLATHGLVNERQPALSGFILSQVPTSGEDNFLQTEEIYALDLKAALVVLSACRTALGKNLSGEGVIGLTRAFLRAGAKSVTATLWQVEDISTADLMIDFYKNLQTLPDTATALRTAKLKMIKDTRFAHPHYWAPFVLIGKNRFRSDK